MAIAKNTFDYAARIRASALAGALGDAYGAPFEQARDKAGIEAVKATITSSGLAPYKPKGYSPDGRPMDQEGVGAITDDTTMLGCTALGFLAAPPATAPIGADDATLRTTYQAFLIWGSRQLNGQTGMTQPVQGAKELPSLVDKFAFFCGAGTGTLTALQQGRMGTIDHPLVMQDKDGKPWKNNGCGGVMRTAPAGWLPAHYDAYAWGTAQAAITHADPIAQAGAGFVALLIHKLLCGENIETALDRSLYAVQMPLGIRYALERMAHAPTPRHADDMDVLPLKVGVARTDIRRDYFSAASVLTQVIGAVKFITQNQSLAATPDGFKKVMAMCAHQRGDSDSVAAIVGNIMGAAFGPKMLPSAWLDALQSRHDIEALARAWTTQFKPVL